MSDAQPEYPDAGNSTGINVLAIVKDTERYIFLFTDEYRAECLRVLGRYASDPELSFTWYDAAVLSQKIRKMSPSQNSDPRSTSDHPHRFTLPLEDE